MWEWIKNWMAESHKKEQEQYSGFTKMLSQMPNAPKAYNKKQVSLLDRIDPSSIQEARAGLSPFGGSTNVLYNALTKGGEKREIFKQAGGLPTKDRKQTMLLGLLNELVANPDFSDTVNVDTRRDIYKELNLEGQPGRYLKYLIMGE